jgi:hypothetical protein
VTAVAVSATTAASTDLPLADWVREHGVVWEISVRSETMAGRRTPIGPALTLAAQCMGPCRMDPACPACQATQRKLRAIALAVLPEGVTSWFDPLEPSFHMRRAAEWAAEVEATVVLGSALPGLAPDAAVAESIRERLLRMGARPRT